MARALAEARDAISGETVVGGGQGPATVFQAADATVVEPAPPAAVRGATALNLARTPARAGLSHLPRTVRPDPTVGGGPMTQAPATTGFRARSSLAPPPCS